MNNKKLQEWIKVRIVQELQEESKWRVADPRNAYSALGRVEILREIEKLITEPSTEVEVTPIPRPSYDAYSICVHCGHPYAYHHSPDDFCPNGPHAWLETKFKPRPPRAEYEGPLTGEAIPPVLPSPEFMAGLTCAVENRRMLVEEMAKIRS